METGLDEGSAVYYNGEVFYVDLIVRDSKYVRIRDKLIFDPDDTYLMFVPWARLTPATVVPKRWGGGKVLSPAAAVKRAERQATGAKDAGDRVAEALRGKSLDEVYKIAAEWLNEDERLLRQKYERLNPGQQRMVLGNRSRKALQ